MSNSFIQLLAFEKVNGDNFSTWKSNLHIILVMDDLRFVLTKESPPVPSLVASQNVRNVRTKSGTSSSKSMKKKGKTHASLSSKKRVTDKGKYFHCNEDRLWERNCSKFLAKR